jgi:hypothetical protein
MSDTESGIEITNTLLLLGLAGVTTVLAEGKYYKKINLTLNSCELLHDLQQTDLPNFN